MPNPFPLLSRRSLFRLLPVAFLATPGMARGQNAAASGVEDRLKALGLTLPERLTPPSGMRLPFAPVRVRGNRAYIAGHGPQNPDGSVAAPLGKVGAEVSVEQGYQAARLTALSILASLKRELGSLDRVSAWLRVFGMVNSAPGFMQQPQVINGFSDLILELYGPDRGAHARSAVGMAALPFGIPVEIEAEVEIDI
jgi:enamine deaminase RidA (YjgF/YER057c/UK114 family)